MPRENEDDLFINLFGELTGILKFAAEDKRM